MTELQLYDKKLLERVDKKNLAGLDYLNSRSTSDNSIRTFQNGWNKFTLWCLGNGYEPLNNIQGSAEFLISLFVSDMANERHLKASSIHTYLKGIRHHYGLLGKELDISSLSMRKLMRGVRRELGDRVNQKAPLTTENIKVLVDGLDLSTNAGMRDRAILLIGFAGAFRRSELASITRENLMFSSQGVSVLIPKSKTDQYGKGRVIDIPFVANEKYCPVRALSSWMERSRISNGGVFLRINKSDKVGDTPILDRAICDMLKRRCEPFGFSSQISGHSLRAGHVTSAIQRGVNETWIMRQTGHTNTAMLKRYERMQNEFVANSAACLGL